MLMPIFYDQYRSIVIVDQDVFDYIDSIVGPWYRRIGLYQWVCEKVERGSVVRCKSM